MLLFNAHRIVSLIQQKYFFIKATEEEKKPLLSKYKDKKL
jgi:hypothetical protein